MRDKFTASHRWDYVLCSNDCCRPPTDKCISCVIRLATKSKWCSCERSFVFCCCRCYFSADACKTGMKREQKSRRIHGKNCNVRKQARFCIEISYMKRMSARWWYIVWIWFFFVFLNENLKLARLRSEFMTATNKIMCKRKRPPAMFLIS